jgi:hypothetical protein
VVHAVPAARVKALREKLPGLLRALESSQITELRTRLDHSQYADTTANQAYASSLGIANLRRGGTDFPGSIYLLPALPVERTAGYVSSTGDPLAQWISAWIREPRQSDNLAIHRGSGPSPSCLL